ncbi:MAG: S1 family peptidase [Actinobacteria bacterium]|nr:S1 family peptidase [Actinomycetota bacterium]
MRQGRVIAFASAGTLCLTALIGTPASATTLTSAPTVIGGQPDHPWSGAAVYFETSFGADGSSCTGALWKPQIIVTAAHCVMEEAGDPIVSPSAITVWPAGANVEAVTPSDAQVTFISAEWIPADAGTVDIAFMTLEKPLGATPITRLAKSQEVSALAKAGTSITYVGYGLTVPRDDPRQTSSPVPLSLSEPLTDMYDENKTFTVLGDGVTSTCAGDSGGPYMREVAGELLLIGPLSGGSGPPCESDGAEADAAGTVASDFAAMANEALSYAGLEPDQQSLSTLVLSEPNTKRGTKVIAAQIDSSGQVRAAVKTRLGRNSPVWVGVYAWDDAADEWTVVSEKKVRTRKNGRLSFTTQAAQDQVVALYDKRDRLLIEWDVLSR